jgi:dienelactone hydrolase
MKRAGTLILGAWLLSTLAFAQTPALIAEHIATLLVEDGKPVRLELLVRKPQGVGPFPTVVFNHGSTGRGDDPTLFKRSSSSATVASYFVELGWMVIFPQRRGRGASDGKYDEGFEPDRSRYSCQPVYSLPGVDRAIQDLDAVMAHIRTRPDVVQSRILLAGQSRGGILSIAYAGERPDAFIGVINFVGGWMSDRCPNAVHINTVTFKRGARFPRPTLWLYGESDPYYTLPHSRSNFEAFVAAGGKGRFESYTVPGESAGHALHMHPSLWAEEVTKYLEFVSSPR